MAYTATTDKAFREKGGSLAKKLAAEFLSIENSWKVVTGTITDGNTSATITHGLDTTPDIVIPVPQDVQGLNYFTSAIGATTFTINVQAPVTGTASFKFAVR